MKVMKKVVVICLVLFAAAGVFALDYGVVIDSRGSVTFQEGADTEFTPREKASIWAENSWESGDMLYTLSGNLYVLYNEDEELVIEPDLLKLAVKQADFLGSGAVLDADIGRFRFTDSTRMALNHVADGVRGRFDFGGYSVTAGLGFTGLQTKPEANISISAADSADENDDDVYFAPNRMISQLKLAAPAIDKGQLFTMEFLLQKDLRGENELDSLHTVIAAEGRITDALFYDASAVNAMDTTSSSSGILLKSGLYYTLEDILYSRISGGVLWGSARYFSLSAPTIGTVFSPGLSNTSRISLDYSMRPWAEKMSPLLRNLQFVLGGNRFAASGEYLGTELVGKILMKPASDFGAGLTMGTYLPDDGDIQGLIQLDVSIGL